MSKRTDAADLLYNALESRDDIDELHRFGGSSIILKAPASPILSKRGKADVTKGTALVRFKPTGIEFEPEGYYINLKVQHAVFKDGETIVEDDGWETNKVYVNDDDELYIGVFLATYTAIPPHEEGA